MHRLEFLHLRTSPGAFVPLDKGSCEKIENRLISALSVRRGTAVPRACPHPGRTCAARAFLPVNSETGRFRSAQFNFFTVFHAALRRHDP